MSKYYVEKILNIKINKKKKNLLTRKKDYLIYKIKYSKYNEYNTTLK